VFGHGGLLHDRLRQLALSGQVNAGGADQAGISTTTSAFQLMAMLYGGPVEAMSYDAAYFATVRASFLPSREALTLLGVAIRDLAVGAVRVLQGGLPQGYQPLTPAEPAEVQAALIMGGEVRYTFAAPVAPSVRRSAAPSSPRRPRPPRRAGASSPSPGSCAMPSSAARCASCSPRGSCTTCSGR
jgi:hypothetical protein